MGCLGGFDVGVSSVTHTSLTLVWLRWFRVGGYAPHPLHGGVPPRGVGVRLSPLHAPLVTVVVHMVSAFG